MTRMKILLPLFLLLNFAQIFSQVTSDTAHYNFNYENRLSLTNLSIDTTATDIVFAFNLERTDSLETKGIVTLSLITTVENDTFSISKQVTLNNKINPFQLNLHKPHFVGDLIYQRLQVKFENQNISKKWLEPVWKKFTPLKLKLFSQSSYLPGLIARFELQVVKQDCVLIYEDIPVKLSASFSASDSATICGKTNEAGFFAAEVLIPEQQSKPIKIKAAAQLHAGWITIEKSIDIRDVKKQGSKTFITTDKNLYQPGEIIHIRTMSLRTSDNKPMINFTVPIKMFDHYKNCLLFKELVTNEYGIAATDFQLADEMILGTYKIHVFENERKVVEINEYNLPYFNLSLTTDKQYYLPEDEIRADIRAEYFYGKPVSAAEVNISITRESREELINGTTDEGGHFAFGYKITSGVNGEAIRFEASVVDKANHTEYAKSAVFVSASTIRLTIVPEFGKVISNFENNFYVVTSAADKRPLSAKVYISCGENSQTLKTDENGFGKFQLIAPPSEEENLIFVVSAIDDFGNVNEKVCYISSKTHNVEKQLLAALKNYNGEQNNFEDRLYKRMLDEALRKEQELCQHYTFFSSRDQSLIIRTDEDYYCQGETAEIICNSIQKNGIVALDFIQNDNWLYTTVVLIKDNQAKFLLKLDQRFSGLITIRSRSNLFAKESDSVLKYFYVAGGNELDIKIKKDRPLYLPGENATLDLSVRDHHSGAATPAAISLNVVDQRVVKLFGGVKENELEFFKSSELLDSLQFSLPGFSPKKLVHQINSDLDEGRSVREDARVAFAELYVEKNYPDTLVIASKKEDFRQYGKNLRDYHSYLFELSARRIFDAFQKFISQNPNFKTDSISIAKLVNSGNLEKRYAENIWGYSYKIEKIYQNEAASIEISVDENSYQDYSDYYLFDEPEADEMELLDIPHFDNDIMLDDFYAENIEVSSSLPAGILPLPVKSVASLKYGRAYILGIDRKFLWYVPGDVAGRIVLDYRQPGTLQPILEVKLDNQKTQTDEYGNFIFRNMKAGRYDLAIAGLSKGQNNWMLQKNETFVFQDTIKSITVESGKKLDLLIEFFWKLNTSLSKVSFFQDNELCAFSDVKEMPTKPIAVRPWSFNNYLGTIKWENYIEPILQWMMGERDSDLRKDVNFSTRSKPYARQNFPETMYWNPSIITDEKGDAQIDIRLADSITDWNLYSSAVSRGGKLGTTISTLRVFQDFFIEVDLPIELTRCDEISVPVAVYNFLDKEQTIQLQLEQAPWFDILGAHANQVNLKPEQVAVFYFDIRIQQFGVFDMRVNAYGSEKSDAIIKSIKVVPEGIKFSEVINGNFENKLEKEIFIPDEAIDGTEQIFLKIFPNTLSEILEGLEGILKMPYGCFEQTASSTYPNIVILDYLKKTGQSLPEIEEKAKKYLEIGYQKLLSFEVSPAGFEWFGHAPANLFLTAYGLMLFSEMRHVQFVDVNVQYRTLMLLFNLQNEDGSWTEKNERRYVDTWTQIMDDPVKETAYVLWAILESIKTRENNKRILNNKQIEQGIQFLTDRIEQIDNPYSLALCANVFYLYFGKDDPKTKRIFDRLLEQKTVEGKEIYWKAAGRSMAGSKGLTANLETTALAGYACARLFGENSNIVGVRTYLLNHRDNRGGWHSTQATTLAIKMLLACLERPLEAGEKISVSMNGSLQRTIHITADSGFSMVGLDLMEITKKGSNKLTISHSAQKSLNFQIISNYYQTVNEFVGSSGKIELLLDADKKNLIVGDTLTCRLKIHNVEENSLGMVVARINVPPYFDFYPEDLKQLVIDGKIQKFEKQGQQLIFYLDKFDSHQTSSLDFRLTPRAAMKAQGFYADVFEYYQPENRNICVSRLVEVRGN